MQKRHDLTFCWIAMPTVSFTNIWLCASVEGKTIWVSASIFVRMASSKNWIARRTRMDQTNWMRVSLLFVFENIKSQYSSFVCSQTSNKMNSTQIVCTSLYSWWLLIKCELCPSLNLDTEANTSFRTLFGTVFWGWIVKSRYRRPKLWWNVIRMQFAAVNRT